MDYLSRRPHRAYASLEHFPSHEKASSERASSVFSRAIHWFTCGTARNTSGALAFAPGSFSALHPMSTDETRERASLRDFPPSKKRVSMKGLHERSRACAAASTTFSSSANSSRLTSLPPSSLPHRSSFFELLHVSSFTRLPPRKNSRDFHLGKMRVFLKARSPLVAALRRARLGGQLLPPLFSASAHSSRLTSPLSLACSLFFSLSLSS